MRTSLECLDRWKSSFSLLSYARQPPLSIGRDWSSRTHDFHTSSFMFPITIFKTQLKPNQLFYVTMPTLFPPRNTQQAPFLRLFPRPDTRLRKGSPSLAPKRWSLISFCQNNRTGTITIMWPSRLKWGWLLDITYITLRREFVEEEGGSRGKNREELDSCTNLPTLLGQ